MSDFRAMQIAKWLAKPKDVKSDSVRAVAYTLESLECCGDLEIFVSEEIDLLGRPAEPRPNDNSSTADQHEA